MARHCSKIVDFNLLNLLGAPVVEWHQLEFRRDIWCQKTRAPLYCMALFASWYV